MPESNPTLLSPRDAYQLLMAYPKRWIVPTVALTLIAAIFSLVRNPDWEASQALIIRNEATEDKSKQGRFTDLTEMKTVQETILELARSRSVLETALKKVGPPASYSKPEQWPTAKDLAQFREDMEMKPPGGAEFGKTEVFYLKVRDKNRQRAIQLVSTICDQLEIRFQKLRNERAQSMIDELKRTEAVAEKDLQNTTSQLAALEASVGFELAELRMLDSLTSTHSNLRQTIVEVENEIRSYEAASRQNKQLLEVLRQAEQDPSHFLATPNSLLASQPALRRLKDGLVDAQLVTARLQGSMSDQHPAVAASKTAEQEVRSDLHDEIAIATKGLEIDLALSADRLVDLKKQLAENRQRLSKLASLRARYSNLVASAESRKQTLESTRGMVAEARADLASARGVSLISRIDAPETGAYPVGPSKKMITLAGLIAGLMTGFGILFLTAPPAAQTTSHRQEAANPAEQPVADERPTPASSVQKLPVEDKPAATRPPAEPVTDWVPARNVEPEQTASADPQENLTLGDALKKLEMIS